MKKLVVDDILIDNCEGIERALAVSCISVPCNERRNGERLTQIRIIFTLTQGRIGCTLLLAAITTASWPSLLARCAI